MSKKDDLPPDLDPDATNTGPLVPPDPDQTVTPKPREPTAKIRAVLEAMDPEDTIKPMPREPDPDATFSGPITQFDPDATIGNSGSVRRRANPFAPKALPEALQVNLAALGGLNPLVAFANPILSAVPQIAAARNHPDPARLRETLQDLIEAFEAGATKIGVQDEVLEGAVYALCCMADDAAASTPWGRDWPANGLLRELRGETNGGEGFFALLEVVRRKPVDNADLLEFLYICLALGFEGRYRNVESGKQELARVRADLHALVTRRRSRPAGGLSGQWRGAAPGATPRATTARAPGAAQGFRWRAIAAPVFALLVLVAGYKFFQRPAPAPEPVPSQVAAAKPDVQPSSTPHQVLEKELAPEIQGGLVSLAEDAGRTTISIRNDRQFASGNIEPGVAVRAVIARVAAALDRAPGPILVKGYTDSMPLKPGQFPSNKELSAARAKAAAALIGSKLGQPQRVTSEGAGEADPVAPNDTEQNRARNRRVAIVLGPQS